MEAVANRRVRRRDGESEREDEGEERREKRRDPSMQEAMKEANIKPSGREVFGEWECVWAVKRAGVQKNTKRYIEPSKMQDARPRVRIRLSFIIVRRTEEGAGWDVGWAVDVEESWVWLSP